MKCLESFYMSVLQQQNLWIYEEKTNKLKQIYALANVTKQHVTQPETHYNSVHTRPAQ